MEIDSGREVDGDRCLVGVVNGSQNVVVGQKEGEE